MMANPFYVEPANPLLALLQGQQGYDRGVGMSTRRAQEQARMQGGGDARGALAALIGAGDFQAAGAVSNIDNNQFDRQFRQTEAQRSQGNTDRSFGLQERQFGQAASRDARDFQLRQDEIRRSQGNADRQYGLQERQATEAGRGFEYREVDNGAGGKTLVRINKATGQIDSMPVDGNAGGATGNPFARGKFNEVQGKSATFVDRMAKAHEVINSTENINDGLTGFIGGMAANDPRIRDSSMANRQFSPQRQMSIQAQRDFINATLRRESGAAIAPSEFENGQRQYFPQPGDSPQVIQQKRENRLTAMRGFAREAGPAYQPPASILPEAAQAGQPGQAATAPKRLRFNPATGTLE
jgi:hypothetical protein